MAWYRSGTIAVTNGSATVTGSGTAWVGAITAGDALHGPDGRVYEIAAVTSATSITITPAYLGSTASGQAYAIQPTRAWTKPLLDTVAGWLAGQQAYVDGPLAGRFADGTALLPGVAFASDVDTGLARLAANVLGLIAGGAERARVTTAGMQITGLLSGTAVQSSLTDTTAGRLLLAGAYGWGGEAVAIPGLDVDGITATGNYQINSSVVSASPNIWSKATQSSSALLHFGRDANNAVQIMVNRTTAVMAVRTKSVGTWGPWREIYHQGSILGTVSQASGVPTGGLIETGSNANGVYTRFADGTQICSATLTGSAGAGVAWTFPAAFAAAPNVGGNAIATVLSALCLDAAPSATAVTVSARDKTDARRADTIHIRATGRWF